MSSNRSCSVKNCEDKQSKRHQFPDFNVDPVLFKKWLDACGNKELYSLDVSVIRRSRKVCHKHFANEFLMANGRISKNAFPTLFLPQIPGEVILEDKSSLSLSSQEGNVGETVSIDFDTNNDNVPPLREESACEQELRLPVTPKKGYALLEEAGVRYQNELTPKAKRLYSCAKKLCRRNTKLKMKLQSHQRLLSKDEILEKLTSSLEPHVARFIKSQIKFAKTKKNGRRYTNDDKILGLIIYKQSPKCYRLLEKLFVVPSKKTVMALLRKIPIAVGINEAVFENLKKNIQSLEPTEKVCVLMFDEMAIEPHISFNGKEFIGFEDLGDSSSNKIADHAIVFMLRSIGGKWKQPVFYGFSHSATKSIDIVRLIKVIIKKCTSIGINVIATVCDQGSANVAAVNYLKKHTVSPEEAAIRPDLFFYYVDGVKIIHIYDAPHLLKGIRNNLVTKELHWENDGEKVVASWNDILTLYKMDNMPGEMRSIPKITDQHVIPRKLKKMKVSCAAQVFSHSVSSLMSLLVRTGATTPEGIKLREGAKGTATILKVFDTLFDSVVEKWNFCCVRICGLMQVDVNKK